MRRVAVLTTLVLLVAACGDDSSSSPLDIAAAAVGAQRAIDQGDNLGDCPWDQQAVVSAVGAAVELVPEFSELGTSNGQVFSGGDFDITYCEIYTSNSTDATTGIEEFRIDVHPGAGELQQYLDEEWGADVENASSSKVEGGTVTSWCLNDDQCIAAWQGNGLFVALITFGASTTTAADATSALKAALPLVVAGLAG